MKFLKSVFTTFWIFWGGFWFMLVISILTLVYAIVLGLFGRKYAMNCVWVNFRVAAPLLLKLYGVKVNIHGTEKINASRTYVFVANHRAQLDIIAGGSTMPKPAKFLAKVEIMRIPFFGWMTEMLAVMVDRKSKESREKSVKYMVDELDKGNSIIVYPEGTRNRTDKPLTEFKDGAFRMAIMAQKPIAVQTLVGTRELNDPRKFHLSPGTVEVYWGTPIETEGMTLNDLPALKEKVKTEMLSHLI